MFCIDLEEKTRNLEENLKCLRKLDSTESLSDSFRDLEVQVKRIKTITDFLKVEEEVLKFNKLLGYEEKIDWDDDDDEPEEKQETQKITTKFITKQVRFTLEKRESYDVFYYNRPTRPINNWSLKFDLGLIQEVPKKKVKINTVSIETKIYFLQLLKQISNSIIDLAHREDWLNEIRRYNDISLEDLYYKFRHNNIYELDIFLEKYNELQDVKITENKYVEKVLHEVENIRTGIMYSWFWELEEKVNELLGTILIKFRIIDMIRDIYLNNACITNDDDRNFIMFESLEKIYKFVCKSEFDFYYDNLLIKLIELKI